ncbi:hypothetical protein GUITHDRAFT_120642 [Guillardia theta CCMP2712]|uniref:PH domain-containing protein n=1 Tax=Guillardia theta (strain CCMP2712) TaxID=905079 RepID=L1IAD9_GUITC|nr:hypothetical protein GUITHDRAFT_120642 [Guillardia theta CCMP2712]EKX33198.1 hypothetical protein GUITHDRAFT_120642 [Guillardia theta CCMP2712]|eukprot:XP_005820178.1 hypothetical protein GUITHDRAFT_120642 [Guillardia theta CCMP2712]
MVVVVEDDAADGAMAAREEEEDLLEGVLLKRGGLFSGWKERLFVLTTKHIVYYESGNYMLASRSCTIKGSIPLSQVKSLDSLPEKKHGKRFCMAICSPSTTWVVRADTESDFNRWRDAIRNAIANAKPKAPQFGEVSSFLSAAGHLNTSNDPANLQDIESPTSPAQNDGEKCQFPGQKVEQLSKMKIVQHAKLEDVYTIGRVIDQGNNGKVFEGVDKRSGERVAIKQIDVGSSVEDDRNHMEIWQQVQHEHVVRLLDFYQTPSQVR